MLAVSINYEQNLDDDFIYEIKNPSFGDYEGDDDRIVINKSDLISNKSNEIVILNTTEQAVYFVSSEELSHHGVVKDQDDNHRAEMAGHHFYIFADGMTVYSRAPLSLEN